jgi:hypothetical protein
MDAQGNLVVLRQGTNHWVCFPGDENEIGNVPMCADPMGLQWMRDIMAGKPAPTNTAPGIIYMLCGATQHSNTDPFDKSSPAIPIGPHWMIIWPYDAVRDGLPNTVRDAGRSAGAIVRNPGAAARNSGQVSNSSGTLRCGQVLAHALVSSSDSGVPARSAVSMMSGSNEGPNGSA